jgi:hypothetical protein
MAQSNVFKLDVRGHMRVESLNNFNSFGALSGYRNALKIKNNTLILLACLVIPAQHNTGNKVEYFIESITPTTLISCSEIFGTIKRTLKIGFLSDVKTCICPSGEKINFDDDNLALIWGGFEISEDALYRMHKHKSEYSYQEQMIFIDQNARKFYCRNSKQYHSFENVVIGLYESDHHFHAVPFLECFPIFALSFDISKETYRNLQEYLENDNIKNELNVYHQIWVKRICGFNNQPLSNNIRLEFSDGIVHFNANCIGWLVRSNSPLISVHGLEESRNTPIDFTFCTKKVFSQLLEFMLLKTTPKILFLSENQEFTQSLALLQRICDYLGLFFYSEFLENVVKIFDVKE